jgi:hypothetical protein
MVIVLLMLNPCSAGPVALAGAPALQQVDLHQVHRIDIRITQLDRALQRGIRVQELIALRDQQQVRSGELVLATHLVEEAQQRLRSQHVVRGGNVQVRARQHRLGIVDQVAQEIPALHRRAHAIEPVPVDGGFQSGTGAVPAGQHVARLRPGEHPRHRPQGFQRISCRTMHRP